MKRGQRAEKLDFRTHPPGCGLCPFSLPQGIRKDMDFGICMLTHTSLWTHISSFVKWTKENQSRMVLWGQDELVSICYCELNENPLHKSKDTVFLILCLSFMICTPFGRCNRCGPGQVYSRPGNYKHAGSQMLPCKSEASSTRIQLLTWRKNNLCENNL